MDCFIYDGTFEGFLSGVFYAFETKTEPDDMQSEMKYQQALFVNKIKIASNKEKATRVWQGIKVKTDRKNFDMIYRVFLSELTGVELLLYRYIKMIFSSKCNITTDFGNPLVQEIHQIHKKVMREADRVLMFIRFQKTKDDLYVATFEPKYNVLPISMHHFKDRFADQKWLIFDLNRAYGYYYDLLDMQEVNFVDENRKHPVITQEMLNLEEKTFQSLWQNYFDSVNIVARKNLKLQMQHMPKRFWKYLPEKNRV